MSPARSQPLTLGSLGDHHSTWLTSVVIRYLGRYIDTSFNVLHTSLMFMNHIANTYYVSYLKLLRIANYELCYEMPSELSASRSKVIYC